MIQRSRRSEATEVDSEDAELRRVSPLAASDLWPFTHRAGGRATVLIKRKPDVH